MSPVTTWKMAETMAHGLAERLSRLIPTVAFHYDRPENSSEGNHFFDLQYKGRSAVIEWRPRYGLDCFAVSLNDANTGYGEGADKARLTLEEAIEQTYYYLCNTTREGVVKEVTGLFFPATMIDLDVDLVVGYTTEEIQERVAIMLELTENIQDGTIGLLAWLKKPLPNSDGQTPAQILTARQSPTRLHLLISGLRGDIHS